MIVCREVGGQTKLENTGLKTNGDSFAQTYFNKKNGWPEDLTFASGLTYNHGKLCWQHYQLCTENIQHIRSLWLGTMSRADSFLIFILLLPCTTVQIILLCIFKPDGAAGKMNDKRKRTERERHCTVKTCTIWGEQIWKCYRQRKMAVKTPGLFGAFCLLIISSPAAAPSYLLLIVSFRFFPPHIFPLSMVRLTLVVGIFRPPLPCLIPLSLSVNLSFSDKGDDHCARVPTPPSNCISSKTQGFSVVVQHKSSHYFTKDMVTHLMNICTVYTITSATAIW